MPGPTYKTSALVLRKAKLGEKDLVVTLLDEKGALVRAVAKGARRPGGALAAKLDLFSAVDVMLARGRSLDVIVDARFSRDVGGRTFSMEQAACAACISELLGFVAQEGLEQEILYKMARAALPLTAQCQPVEALALCAAALWKIVSAAGFRPRFDSCAVCGRELEEAGFRGDAGGKAWFSPLEGGCICAGCAHPADAVALDVETVRWCRYLMGARFGEIVACGMDPKAAFGVLELLRCWMRAHLGRNLKSLDFVFASGLF